MMLLLTLIVNKTFPNDPRLTPLVPRLLLITIFYNERLPKERRRADID